MTNILPGPPGAWKATLGAGFIWAHTSTVKNLVASHPVLVLVERYPDFWNNRLRGHNPRNRIGFAAGAVFTGQPRTLGTAIPVMFQYDARMAGLGKQSTLRFNMGTGLAYWTKPFNLVTNVENSAIGSRITWALQARFSLADLPFPGGLNSEIGLGIYHSSNGAFRLPNLGLNIPMAHLTATIPTAKRRTILSDVPLSFSNRQDSACHTPGLQLWSSLAAGFKMADYAPSKIYGNYTGRVSALWRVSARSGLTLGADWIHHRALKAESVFYNEPEARDFNRIGLAAGHDWFIARGIAITTQVGVYLRNPAPGVHKPLYQRYGVRFNTDGRLSPAVLFRSHLGQADCLEWTVAYRLFSTNN